MPIGKGNKTIQIRDRAEENKRTRNFYLEKNHLVFVVSATVAADLGTRGKGQTKMLQKQRENLFKKY